MEIQPPIVVPKEMAVFDANQEPVPLKYVPKRSQQPEEEPQIKHVVPVIKIEEQSLIETVIEPVEKSIFVDVMKESQFALQQGQVKWITRNLRSKGEPVNIKILNVVQNYF